MEIGLLRILLFSCQTTRLFINYLGLDEGAGVDDLDIIGLMHHQSLDVPIYSFSIRSDTQAEKSLVASPMLFHFIFKWSSEL